jgi:hypothetical protein
VNISGANQNRIGTNANGISDALERNVISGNGTDGIVIFVASSNEVAGNYIGTDLSGAAPLGNGRYGINVGGSNTGSNTGNIIGGSIAKANVIAFNAWSGVCICGGITGTYPVENRILYNSIFSNGDNGEVGITLQPGDTLYGVTPNDPGDSDEGANYLVNFPELNSALAINNSVAISGGIVDGLPNASFLIQFFANPECDQYAQHGEGKVFLGETSEMTNGSGDVSFLVNFAQAVSPGEFITATATWNNSTSEFSECVEVTAGTQLQGDSEGFEPGLVIIPTRNLNCRYYCTSQADIADTLLQGIEYRPIGWDAASGYLAFLGPAFGELCFAPPQANGTELMGLSFAGQPVASNELSPDLIEARACPAFPTPTPTVDPDEGAEPTATPAPLPECSDGIDNDGDGRIDYNPTGRGDAECRNAADNDEANP